MSRRDFEAMLTAEDLAHMSAALDASADGDLDAAWRHHTSAPFIERSAVTQDLAELLRLGPDAPSWAWDRWVPRLAHQWLLKERDTRVEECAVEALVTSHWQGVDAEAGNDPGWLGDRLTLIAGCDWVYRQRCIWERGGLADFLDLKAGPGLLARATGVRSWTSSRLGGYRLEGITPEGLEVVDLGTGESNRVLSIGAAGDRGPGATVLGRLVPAGVAPGLMFESRPVDAAPRLCEEFARVTAESGDWLDVLTAAAEDGRWGPEESVMPWTPLITDLTPVALDLVDREPAGRIRDLMARGLRRDVAEALGVCEVGLIAARISPDGIGGSAPHVATVLADREVFDAALQHCTDADNRTAWETVARSVPEPARGRCLALARACEAHDAA